jgi:hypothetical protein
MGSARDPLGVAIRRSAASHLASGALSERVHGGCSNALESLRARQNNNGVRHPPGVVTAR